MNEQKQVSVNLDPNAYHLTNVQVQAGEEQFVLRLFSGNSARQYVLTPKHAKRIMLLLQKHIEGYEDKFEEIEASLPNPSKKNNKTGDVNMGFNPPNTES